MDWWGEEYQIDYPQDMGSLNMGTISQGQDFYCQMKKEVHSQGMEWFAILKWKESHVSREIYGPFKVKTKKSTQHGFTAEHLIQCLDLFTVFV